MAVARKKEAVSAEGAAPGAKQILISAPKFGTVIVKLIGTAPYVQNAFSSKTREQMRAKHEAGETAKMKKKREPKDFQGLYERAMHKTKEGWHGIPAIAFRAAMISACRIVGFQMTRAKLAFSIEADGYDAADGVSLVKITKGEPHYSESLVRNDDGSPDIRPRPMWDEGWEAILRIRFDMEMFSPEDALNLARRAGLQVGVGEGRPDSKNSVGMGWGTFNVADPGGAK